MGYRISFVPKKTGKTIPLEVSQHIHAILNGIAACGDPTSDASPKGDVEALFGKIKHSSSRKALASE